MTFKVVTTYDKCFCCFIQLKETTGPHNFNLQSVDIMPRCEGRPDGDCPSKINNASVTLCQGDLMLCRECESFRFPCLKPDKSDKSTLEIAPTVESGGSLPGGTSTTAQTN